MTGLGSGYALRPRPIQSFARWLPLLMNTTKCLQTDKQTSDVRREKTIKIYYENKKEIRRKGEKKQKRKNKENVQIVGREEGEQLKVTIFLYRSLAHSYTPGPYLTYTTITQDVRILGSRSDADSVTPNCDKVLMR